MADNVLPFPYGVHPTQPVAQFIRLGELQYQSLGTLLAEGKLPAKRIVVDASKIRHQRELIKAFKETGAEIVLDTKAAELASPQKCAGFAKGAPWAALNDGKPLGPEFFSAGRADDIFGQIARCAIDYQCGAVLAPCHFIGDKLFGDWFDVDRQACLLLRQALDNAGGAHIAIDYSLIVPHVQLNDPDRRSTFVSGLEGLPFDNLWIRASGFGNDATALPATRYMSALTGLHNIGRPIVADYLGGIIAEAALAFGVISGIAHGIGERERFSAYGWEKPPPKSEDGFGGRARRIVLSRLNRSFTLSEFELLCSARGGRQLLIGTNRSRFPSNMQDMLQDPQGYVASEAMHHVDALAGIPDLRRGQHFLQGRMTDVARVARQVKDLKPLKEKAAEKEIDADKLMKRLSDHSAKIDKLHSSFEYLNADLEERGGRAQAVTRGTPAPGMHRRQP